MAVEAEEPLEAERRRKRSQCRRVRSPEVRGGVARRAVGGSTAEAEELSEAAEVRGSGSRGVIEGGC